MNNLQLIESALCYIDEHLNENITFERLAEIFGYSPFHFHKIFSSVTSQTITDYLRKRRLMYAHMDLCETEKTITEICYENGFGSIQSFNRIFKTTYGMLPSDVRKEKIKIDYKSIQTIIEGYTKRVPFKGEYIMEPRFVEKDEFVLVGSRKYTGNGFQVIGEAWEELKSNWHKIKRTNPNTMYGFEDYSEDFQKEPLQFYYMAAVEAESNTDIPDGMCMKRIPKAYYAVFTVNGNNANGEIGKAFRYIYDVWLPSSEYYLSHEVCADFEYYDERWDCQSSSAQMDLYIPVHKLLDRREADSKNDRYTEKTDNI
ncbi:MAG: AraC family transcriptional regulator [Lachnospiraceae bacterium]